ncbi:hypothetical protein I6E29_05325 [Arcanobacterium haemolyticum]|nr:hypothetical protein [Arcanobacterium haemolyticum]
MPEDKPQPTLFGQPIYPSSLLWAGPFLVFFAFPIGEIYKHLDGRRAASLYALIGLMVIVYVWIWLLNEPAPAAPSRSHIRRYAAMLTLLTLIQIALWIFVHEAGGSGGAYLLSFVVSATALLSPRRYMYVLSGLVGVLAFIEVLIFAETESFAAFITVFMTATVCLASRYSIDRGRVIEEEYRQAAVLAHERERTRISADLHDILGQSLTTITMKADLAGRLLDAGKTEEARGEIDDLVDMSRTALADVREVVAANRALTPASEIEAATVLLRAADVRLTVITEGEPPEGTWATLVAHTIREGCANAMRHSRPSEVIVEIRDNGVRITNDGVKAATRWGPLLATMTPTHDVQIGTLNTTHGGTGLDGLRTRIAGRGTLTWSEQGDSWILDLTLGSERTQQ